MGNMFSNNDATRILHSISCFPSAFSLVVSRDPLPALAARQAGKRRRPGASTSPQLGTATPPVCLGRVGNKTPTPGALMGCLRRHCLNLPFEMSAPPALTSIHTCPPAPASARSTLPSPQQKHRHSSSLLTYSASSERAPSTPSKTSASIRASAPTASSGNSVLSRI